MNSLRQLACEYDEAILMIEDIVKKTRTEMKKARQNYDSDEVRRLSSKLAVLYEEIRDMKIISEKLRDYYADEKNLQEAV